MKNGSKPPADVFLLGAFSLLFALFSLCDVQAQGKPKEPGINADARIIQEFENRISAYVKLHKSIEAKLPALTPTDSAEKILQHQQELARRISEARKESSEGDVFSPDVREEFRRLIAMAVRGDQRTRIHQSLAHSEPVQFPLAVNASYPAGAPLQTTPPTLLQNLPTLPPELEYRVVGHQLILRDVKANLIVDFMGEAIP